MAMTRSSVLFQFRPGRRRSQGDEARPAPVRAPRGHQRPVWPAQWSVDDPELSLI